MEGMTIRDRHVTIVKMSSTTILTGLKGEHNEIIVEAAYSSGNSLLEQERGIKVLEQLFQHASLV